MTPRVEVGLLVVFFVAHAVDRTLQHVPWDSIWACHVACLWVAVGIALRSPLLSAMGLCWTVFGNSLWAIDLASGGELIKSSIPTHLGGLFFGLRAVHRHGFPAGAWWRAAAAMLALEGITRVLTPRALNVNLAFTVYPGWEGVFPTYPRYFAFLFVVCCASYFATELLVRRVLSRRATALAVETPS